MRRLQVDGFGDGGHGELGEAREVHLLDDAPRVAHLDRRVARPTLVLPTEKPRHQHRNTRPIVVDTGRRNIVNSGNVDILDFKM